MIGVAATVIGLGFLGFGLADAPDKSAMTGTCSSEPGVVAPASAIAGSEVPAGLPAAPLPRISPVVAAAISLAVITSPSSNLGSSAGSASSGAAVLAAGLGARLCGTL